MQHIIKRQVIDLKIKKTQDAFRMQHLISEHYRNEIVNVLEDAFNKYCSEDEVILLDKLEIDFGTISETDLEKTRWDETILAKFKANLLENLAALSSNKTFAKQSKAINICKQWIFYMQHGYLNWNTLLINDQWYNSVLEILAIDYSSVATLREIISQDKKIAHRISLQHDAVFLTKLVEILTAQNQKSLSKALEEIYHVLNLAGHQKYKESPAITFIKLLWQQVIIITAIAKENLSLDKIINVLIQAYAPELPVQKRKQTQILSAVSIIKKQLAALFEEQAAQNKSQQLLAEELKKNQTKKDNDIKQTEEENLKRTAEPAIIERKEKLLEKRKEQKQVSKKTKKQVEAEKNKSEKMNRQKKEVDKENKKEGGDIDGTDFKKQNLQEEVHEDSIQSLLIEKTEIENYTYKNYEERKDVFNNEILKEIITEQGIFIHHAGIVLAHPFLGHLFKRLDWIKDNQFINIDAQLKAVFMLHYLATGKTIAEEYHLLLHKLICGYPLNDAMPYEMIFTETELAEADDMLTAMIQQWNKLQNTSITGLREGFLQRSGKLFMKNDTPHVQVESHTIDVLLDYLPWNLSMIKLPWMKEIIRVEWR